MNLDYLMGLKPNYFLYTAFFILNNQTKKNPLSSHKLMKYNRVRQLARAFILASVIKIYRSWTHNPGPAFDLLVTSFEQQQE